MLFGILDSKERIGTMDREKKDRVSCVYTPVPTHFSEKEKGRFPA